MPNLKHRLMDQTRRQINRRMRIEICVVVAINNHETPADRKFNTVDVIMRDRVAKADEYRFRKQVMVPPNYLGGHCMGATRSPRVGEVVLVCFYSDREAYVIGPAWSWAEYPVCRPTPYDIADKGGQWMAPYQDEFGDFPVQPYPETRKPFCFRWFHGPVTGSTGPGRDWAWLFDYCHMGDTTPSCKDCKTIDSICHIANHFLKFYSTETESRKAYPGRGIYHAPGGGYWLFESTDKPSDDYVSEFYTKGAGFWTLQGAIAEVLKGHVRHHPEGDIEFHSATSDPADNNGTRCTVAAPSSATFDFAWEAIQFLTGAYRRILKSGKIEDSSSSEIKMIAPDIVLVGNVTITGSISHGADLSCDAEGGSVISSTGTGSQQTIAHGVKDALNTPCCPGSVTPVCSGGTCTINSVDQTNVHVTCTGGIPFQVICTAPEDGWGGWKPCF